MFSPCILKTKGVINILLAPCLVYLNKQSSTLSRKPQTCMFKNKPDEMGHSVFLEINRIRNKIGI